MTSTCDTPFCTTLACMMSEGRVVLERESDESRCRVKLLWIRDDGTTVTGVGANVRDAVAEACEKKLEQS